MKADVQQTGPPARLTRILTWRYLPIALAILAMALTLPSLSVGWVLDDHIQRWAMTTSSEHSELLPTPPDIWRFFDGDPLRNKHMMDVGWAPWWTYPQLKWAFWRPLASLTHTFDYHFWPYSSELMHAQSILWFGALIACTTLLYRRFIPAATAAGLAALLYALDDSHGTAVGFLANRNVLLATLFGVLALLAHHRWRGDSWAGPAALGPILLGMSLLSAEAGLGIFAYILVYEIILDCGPLAQKLKRLLPYVLVVLAWRILWKYQGYGVQGVGFYTDPLTNTISFLLALPRRMPILLLGQWATPPAEYSIFSPQNLPWIWLIALTLLLLLVVLFLPLLKRSRVARFWGLGMILASIAPCASSPQDRQLFFVGIGAMGLLSEYLVWAFSSRLRDTCSRSRLIPTVLLAVALGAFHIVGSPILLGIRARWPMGPQSLWENCHELGKMDSSLGRQDLIFLNHPIPGHAMYMLSARAVNKQPMPRRTRVLASALSRTTVTRPNAHTLSIRLKRGYLDRWFDKMFRSQDHPIALGQRIELTGMIIEVTELTDDGRPLEVSFRFEVPLEDPSLRWLWWNQDHFEPFVPPAIGETIGFPRAKLPL